VARERDERRRVGAGYALALYELAAEQGRLDEVRADVAQLGRALSEAPDVVHFISAPAIRTSQRQQVIDQLSAGLDDLVAGALTVMNRRGRLAAMPELVAAFAAQDDKRQGRIPTSLVTATPVAEVVLARIRSALARFLRREPIITAKVDPAILGGFVARAGDTLIDASVRTQLATVKSRLLERGQDEVQSG
jgi:F-type H+-transporting ATPase subunit delta